MENKTEISELELPQIRQMVLENTRRINKNELNINEIRMKQEEESRKRREREERLSDFDRKLERAREEHDREMHELREMMHNHFIHLEEDRKRRDEERKKDREKHDEERRKDMEKRDEERWKDKEEQKERDEKLDKYMSSINASIEEMRKDNAEAKEAVKKLSTTFTSVVGHIVEGLLGPKGHEMFAAAGFKVDRYCKDMYRKIKEQNLAMEVDVLSYGEDLAIATEVKTNCRKKDIDEFLDKMKLFRQLFTEHQDKEVLAAIAAVNFERDAYEYAKQQGILIIHVIDESVFTLDPVPDKSALRRF